jgi:hypothetical protein
MCLRDGLRDAPKRNKHKEGRKSTSIGDKVLEREKIRKNRARNVTARMGQVQPRVGLVVRGRIRRENESQHV